MTPNPFDLVLLSSQTLLALPQQQGRMGRMDLGSLGWQCCLGGEAVGQQLQLGSRSDAIRGRGVRSTARIFLSCVYVMRQGLTSPGVQQEQPRLTALSWPRVTGALTKINQGFCSSQVELLESHVVTLGHPRGPPRAVLQLLPQFPLGASDP